MPDEAVALPGAAEGAWGLKAFGAGVCGCGAKPLCAGDSVCGGASFIAETKAEPKGIAGAVVTSIGADARCCAAGVNKVEMDACAMAGGVADPFSADAGANGDGAGASVCCEVLKGEPFEPLPNEKGNPAGLEGAGAAGCCEALKGEPFGPPPNEKGDPAGVKGVGAAGCCGMPKGEPLGLAPTEKGEAGGCCAAGSAFGWLIRKGEPGWDAGRSKENGDGDGAAAGADAPSCLSRAWAINPGSLAEGSATMRGSWGEMGA